jgi:hypothetical protein
MTRFYLVFLNVVRNLDENINSFFISFHFFIFNQSINVLNVLINVFKLIFFFKSFFILVWRLYHDIFDVINVNNERWAMLTSSFNHSKCSKKRLITQQRSRFVSKEESSSSSAKIVKAKTICWIDSSFARCASCANNDKFVDQCDVNRDEYDEMNERKQKIVMSSIKKRIRKLFSSFSSTSLSISSSLKSKFRKRWVMFNLEMFICETIQD